MKTYKHRFVTGFVIAGLTIAQIAVAKPICPSQNFGTFLNRYSEEINTQQNFTRIPLRWEYHTPDEDRVSYLKQPEIKFPILMSKNDRAQQGVKLSFKKQTSRQYTVFTRSAGSDAYSFDMVFKQTQGCWRLIKVSEWSS